MTFEGVANRLMGLVPALDPLAALEFVSNAYRDAAQQANWSWLARRSAFIIPAQVSTGAVAVTKGSANVTFNGAAAAVLDIFGSNPLITECTLKVGDVAVPIKTYVPGGVAALDYEWPGATNAAASYILFRQWVAYPADFQQWEEVIDRARNYALCINVGSHQLNRVDPGRIAVGQVTHLVPSVRDGYMELWPRAQPVILDAGWLIKPAVLSLATWGAELPSTLSEDTLLNGAKYYAYEWAAANVGRRADLRGVSWRSLQETAWQMYQANLKRDKRTDEERYPKQIRRQGFGQSATSDPSYGGLDYGPAGFWPAAY